MDIDCDCGDFKESMKQIVSAEELAWLHGWRYTGEQFKYCPWCGKKFEQVEVEEYIYD